MYITTIRILDGPDKGKVYEHLSLPITIGREEDNTIQLNDERVSRFHARIQIEDQEIFIADLESTNGTRVNGENIQIAILRPGDTITIGSCFMLFGDKLQIVERIRQLQLCDEADGVPRGLPEDDYRDLPPETLEARMYWSNGDPNIVNKMQMVFAPHLPGKLSPLQRAQLCELLQFFQLRLRQIVQAAEMFDTSSLKQGGPTPVNAGKMVVPANQWQNLIDLYEKISQYLLESGNPEN